MQHLIYMISYNVIFFLKYYIMEQEHIKILNNIEKIKSILKKIDDIEVIVKDKIELNYIKCNDLKTLYVNTITNYQKIIQMFEK